MTNPPQDDERDESRAGQRPEPGRPATPPLPSYDRTQPAPSGPGTPWGQPPAQPYGQSAPPYGEPTPSYVRPPVPGAAQPPAAPPPVAPAWERQETAALPTPPQQYPQPEYGQQPPQYGGPQYGGPQYGPPGQYGYAPPPPPPPKSKVGLIAAATGLVLLVIAGVVVLVMALQSSVLDRAAVERDVAAQFEEREGVAIDLECADQMKVDAGSTYECTGTTADGEDVTLQIRIEDEDSAAYTWTEP
jgi:hypothetical protein